MKKLKRGPQNKQEGVAYNVSILRNSYKHYWFHLYAELLKMELILDMQCTLVWFVGLQLIYNTVCNTNKLGYYKLIFV